MKQKTEQNNLSKINDTPAFAEPLHELSRSILNVEHRIPMSFDDFLKLAAEKPKFAFRDIFMLFYDMIKHFVPPGIEEYPDHSESIGFLQYDSSKLFVEDCDSPFFADRLFMNRLMNIINNFKAGSLNNQIFIFEGPPGSGKSTFLNNFLLKLEAFTHLPQGTMYKTYWKLDIEKLGGFNRSESLMNEAMDIEKSSKYNKSINLGTLDLSKKYLQFSCPKHDHPILQVPKQFRADFLDKIIIDKEFKEKLFYKKEYEWVLKEIPCSICQGLFSVLLDELKDPLEVFKMLYARKIHFNRQFGEGISVYNPTDEVNNYPIHNKNLESMIHLLLKNDSVNFIYSDLARTNNGILALMDIKENNIKRLLNLHGIISDGIHKVMFTEERIKSLFVGLVNPEDKIHYQDIKSFQDRIVHVNISYILDYNTEVLIYKHKFGKSMEKLFPPRVLENFAKIIISTRMNTDTPPINKWLGSLERYNKYCDKNGLLLKMDVYTGKIPDYLSEDDVAKFNREIRKEFLIFSEQEGKKGISGRQSLNIFSQFLSKYKNNGSIISMDNVFKFFTNNDEIYKLIPPGFIDSVIDLYDYNVLQEVKESIYYYNDEQIIRDIQNYLFAINYDMGEVKKSKYTGDTIEINENYFKNIEPIFLGIAVSDQRRYEFRQSVLHEYITKTVAQDMNIKGLKLTETDQFQSLFEKYIRNLKENALAPFDNNDILKRALVAFGTEKFHNFDDRTISNVNQLMTNLQNKFHYSADAARNIGLYVLEKELNKKYK